MKTYLDMRDDLIAARDILTEVTIQIDLAKLDDNLHPVTESVIDQSYTLIKSAISIIQTKLIIDGASCDELEAAGIDGSGRELY